MLVDFFVFRPHCSTAYIDAAYCYCYCLSSQLVCQSVCLSVCLLRLRSLPKRLNRSRCRLSCGLSWAEGTMYMMRMQMPTCARSILTDVPFWGGMDDTLWSIGTLCRELCKNSWTDRDAISVVDLGVSKKACLIWSASWCNLANTIEPPRCGGDKAFLSNYFDRLLVKWNWNLHQFWLQLLPSFRAELAAVLCLCRFNRGGGGRRY